MATATFGERLKREREKRGVSLEEVAEATKITSTALRALENNEFDKLPGGIFKKGFVRAYAHYLGMDEDRAVEDFVAVAGEDEQPLPNPPIPRRVQLQIPEPKRMWPRIAGGAFVLAAILAVWKSGPLMREGEKIWEMASKPAQVEDASSTPAPAPVEPVKSRPPKTSSRSAQPAPPPVEEAAKETLTAPQAPPQPAAAGEPQKPAAPEHAKAEPPAHKLTARERRAERRARLREARAAARVARALQAKAPAHIQQVQTATTPPPAENKGEFVVQVLALKDAWVQIIVDGEVYSDGLLVPPARKRVRGHREVVVKTANAAAVEVLFNGQPLPPLGEDNQVATVTFNSGGIRR